MNGPTFSPLPVWRGRLRRAAAAATLLAAAAMAGCGPRPIATIAEVSGTIVFHGRPMVAEVLFQPIDDAGKPAGRPSLATSDPRGRYRLDYTPGQKGAQIGRHLVTVNLLPFSNTNQPGLLFDARAKLKQTRLLRTVKPGANTVHLVLSL